MKRALWILMLASLVPCAVQAQSPVKWSFSQSAMPDGHVVLSLTAAIEEGWHVYATQLSRDDGPLPTVFRFTPNAAYALDGQLQEPDPIQKDDPNFMMTLSFHEGTAVFQQALSRKTAEAFNATGEVEFMVCNAKMCLPPTVVPFSIEVPALKPE